MAAPGLPVVEFVQADSTLLGAEAHLDVRLRGPFWLELGADAVRGEIDGSGDPLPRMPPYPGWTALRYQTRRFHLEAEVRSARRQDRIYGAETATGGYAVVNLHGSYTFTQARAAHTFRVRLDNAADELYRNHLSYVKDLAPEAGRSFKVVYGVRF